MTRKIIFIAAIVFCSFHMFVPESLARADVKRHIRKGNRFYDKGHYQQALKEYTGALTTDSESLIANYNMGTALYKLEDYETAKGYFKRGLTSRDRALAQRSFYNLANTQYYLGISKEDSSLSEAIGLLKESLRYYENAITMDTEDEDAAYNHDFVKKELDRLKERLQQQQQAKDNNHRQDQTVKTGHPGPQTGEHEGSRQRQSGKDSDRISDEDPADADKQETAGQDSGQRYTPAGTGQGINKHAQGMTQQSDIPSDMSDIEARALLDNYLRHEEPGAMYPEKLQPRREDIPVDKNW
jgi:Ca-activated chloride channel homolog